MSHYKLNDADEHFLNVPQGGALISAGASGTETWIERDRDMVVRIAVHTVAVATAEAGSVEVCIEIGGDRARGQDGPAPVETTLRASQSVQVLVKAGERLAFKAYPNASHAMVLRTVVWAADLKYDRAPEAPARGAPEHPAAAGAAATTTNQRQAASPGRAA